jgi:hypothetical protein
MFHVLTKPMAAAVALTVGLTACGSSEDGDSGEQPAAAASAAVPAADTTGAAIWAHLQESDYQTNWELWPDKGRLYGGGPPHGMLLTTYLNDVAHQALTSGAATMPAGAVVVKENYMPDSTLAAVTTMFKVSGYNADHNDWFFTKHLASGALDTMPNGMEMEGRLGGCQGCHGARADNDYLFTSVLGGS